MALSANSGPQLGGFLTPKQAVRQAVVRRRARMGGMLGVGIWPILVAILADVLKLDGLTAAVLWLGGTAVILAVATRFHRSAKQAMTSSLVVNERGHIVGTSDEIGSNALKRLGLPIAAGYGTFHVLGELAGLVTGDRNDLPGPVLVVMALAGLATYVVARRRFRRAIAD